MICFTFCQFYEKVVLRLIEHGDVNETQKIILYLCEMHNNMYITQSLYPQKAFLENSAPDWKTNG